MSNYYHSSQGRPLHFRNEARPTIRFYGNSHLMAHYLAAEERHQRYIAEAARETFLRQSGLRQPGLAATFAAVRETIGALLIRMGRRLERAHRPTAGAMTAGVGTTGQSR